MVTRAVRATRLPDSFGVLANLGSTVVQHGCMTLTSTSEYRPAIFRDRRIRIIVARGTSASAVRGMGSEMAYNRRRWQLSATPFLGKERI